MLFLTVYVGERGSIVSKFIDLKVAFRIFFFILSETVRINIWFHKAEIKVGF